MATRYIRNSGPLLFPRRRDDRSRTPEDLTICLAIVDGRVCGKIFVDAAALNRHRKIHEPGPIYTCPACGEGEVKPDPRPHGRWQWVCQNCRSDFGDAPRPLLE